MTTPITEERAAVYRFYTADDTLLYVGVTQRFGTRWSAHAKQQPWWSQVARQASTWYDTRAEALAIETEAIKTEKPVHNVIHVPKPPKPRKPQDTTKHTPLRQLRIPEDEWKPFGELVGDRERTSDVRAYIRWRLRNPDTDLPERPASSEEKTA